MIVGFLYALQELRHLGSFWLVHKNNTSSIVQIVKVQHNCLFYSMFDVHWIVQFFLYYLVFDLHKYKTKNSKLMKMLFYYSIFVLQLKKSQWYLWKSNQIPHENEGQQP